MAHEIIPVVHGLPVLQLMPAEHATQRPIPSHTPPAHVAPAARGAPGVHTGAPVAHEIIPLRHSLAGVHAEPATHATHAPRPSQTPPAQGVPPGELACATHAGALAPQTIAPVRQGSAGVHALPSLQAKHVPAALQVEPDAHVPQEPPQRSSPHCRPEHWGEHASLPVSVRASVALSYAASVRTPPSGMGCVMTSGVVHWPSSPQVCPRSSQ
jgi:hypothetical protein